MQVEDDRLGKPCAHGLADILPGLSQGPVRTPRPLEKEDNKYLFMWYSCDGVNFRNIFLYTPPDEQQFIEDILGVVSIRDITFFRGVKVEPGFPWFPIIGHLGNRFLYGVMILDSCSIVCVFLFNVKLFRYMLMTLVVCKLSN